MDFGRRQPGRSGASTCAPTSPGGVATAALIAGAWSLPRPLAAYVGFNGAPVRRRRRQLPDATVEHRIAGAPRGAGGGRRGCGAAPRPRPRPRPARSTRRRARRAAASSGAAGDPVPPARGTPSPVAAEPGTPPAPTVGRCSAHRVVGGGAPDSDRATRPTGERRHAPATEPDVPDPGERRISDRRRGGRRTPGSRRGRRRTRRPQRRASGLAPRAAEPSARSIQRSATP